MIIKTEKYNGHGTEYIKLQGFENGKSIFGADATVKRELEDSLSKWTTMVAGKWSPWTISFGSCNDDIEYMEKRVKVINRALALARKLNNK